MATLLILIYTAFIMTLTLTIFMDLSFWFPLIFVIAFFVAGCFPINKKEKTDA